MSAVEPNFKNTLKPHLHEYQRVDFFLDYARALWRCDPWLAEDYVLARQLLSRLQNGKARAMIEERLRQEGQAQMFTTSEESKR